MAHLPATALLILTLPRLDRGILFAAPERIAGSSPAKVKGAGMRYENFNRLNAFVCSTSATSVGRRSIEEAP